MKVSVIGSGSWGSALADVIAYNGNNVTMYARKEAVANEINNEHTNLSYLKDVKLSEKIVATTDMKEAIKDAEVILIAVPTKGIREVSKKLNAALNEANLTQLPIIGHATKGLEKETSKPVSQLLIEELDNLKHDDVYFISGPSHAESVVKKDLTLVAVASKNQKNAQVVQTLLNNDEYFRAEYINDLYGAEYAGAFKNVYALGGGMLAGAGFSDNASAAFMTYALREMKALCSVVCGADAMTLDSLAGLGDLIVTAGSDNSRNYRAGYAVGTGLSLEETVANMGMVVEGVNTVNTAHKIALTNNLDLPLLNGIYDIINEGLTVKQVIKKLLSKDVSL